MTILLTGGCGFIGSHVVERLVNSDLRLATRVLYHTCCEENIKNVKDNPAFEMVKGDIMSFPDVLYATKDVTSIIHMAAKINVDESRFIPWEYFETNLVGTVKLLEQARKRDIEKFTYMSTAEIYGHVPKGKAKETQLVNPSSPYAASKYAAERFCVSYSHTYGLPVTIVRGFNVYGPRQKYGAKGAVIAIFIVKGLKGEPLKIFGGGTQTRDYLFVKDVADGIVKAHLYEHKGVEMFNIASGKEVSIINLANDIMFLTGEKSYVECIDGRPGENTRSCGDSSRARSILKWKPKTQLRDGLRVTTDYYKSK